MGFYDRFELPMAQQIFDINNLRGKVSAGLGADAIGRNTLDQTIVGAKFRVFGEAVLDAHTWAPRAAVGMQYKKNHDGEFVKGAFTSAKQDHGFDLYAFATKLLLAQNLLLNGTLRFTKANQFGLLGFGGSKDNSIKPELELSAAYLLR